MSSIAKPDKPSEGSFWRGLFQGGLYKPTQGRIVRQVTWAALAAVFVLLAYEVCNAGWVTNLFRGGLTGGQYMVLAVLGSVGVWVAYRMVNYPRLADFLISVEAEMNKVSWANRSQIWRASLVVITVILTLALALWVFDIVWTWLFKLVGIRN
jgi:preprotein translocase subunit SecE